MCILKDLPKGFYRKNSVCVRLKRHPLPARPAPCPCPPRFALCPAICSAPGRAIRTALHWFNCATPVKSAAVLGGSVQSSPEAHKKGIAFSVLSEMVL